MKKIIIKCKLSNRDTFESKLNEIDLDFGAIYWQHDRVYVPRGYKPKSNFPRLIMRTELKAIDEQPTYYLILRRHIEDSGIDIIEKTPVIDYATTANIILQLGFKQSGEVSRRRQDLDMGEGTIIHLDELDNSQETYAKIETVLNDAESVEAVKKDLVKTFETLGETNLINLPYAEL